MINSISVFELLNDNYENIIDIRSNEKYKKGHINKAINIPSNTLIASPKEYLNTNTKYYIYCQRGIQSVKVCMLLGRMGYNVVNVNGGYDAWINNN